MPVPKPSFATPDFCEFAHKALHLAGMTVPDWLEGVPVRRDVFEALTEQRQHYDAARTQIPRSAAHWEQADFLRSAVRAAIWDLQWGAIATYEQFEALYLLILGSASRPYLPQVFSAAALSPSLAFDFASELLGTLTRARIEEARSETYSDR